MSKILEDHGDVRISRDGKQWYARELLLDCGCCLEIPVKDLYDAVEPNLLIKLRVSGHRCEKPKQLPEAVGVMSSTGLHQDDPRDLQIAALTREAGMWRSKYEQLSITYNKLADQWNVFQATARPDNRNIQRAEGAGEATRKLAEVFLALAYDRDAHDLIATLVEMLQDLQRGGAGRTVEVSEKLVRSPDRG